MLANRNQAQRWSFPTWDELAESCGAIEGLSREQRQAASMAFVTLGRHLGRDLLSGDGAPAHPLCMPLLNSAPWSRLWTTWFAAALEQASESKGFESLLARLRDPKRYVEAASVLEVGARLLRVGFRIQYDVEISVGARRKVPDLHATDLSGGPSFFVEVTRLNESNSARKASRTTMAVHNELMMAHPFAPFAGRIYRALSPAHLADVVQEIRESVRRANDGGGLQIVNRAGVILLGLAADKEEGVVDAWAKQHELSVGTLDGPYFDSDQVHRTRQAIGSKQDQLPRDGFGIVVVDNAPNYPWIRDPAEAMSLIEEEVFEHPHLSAAVITGSNLGVRQPQPVVRGVNEYVRICSFGALIEHAMLIPNRFTPKPLPAETIGCIATAFEQPLDRY